MIKGMYGTFMMGALVLGSAPLPIAQEAWRFTLKPEESRFTVDVGRAGFLKVFGHDHVVEIRGFRGEVAWEPASPESSSIRVEVDAASLTVVDEESEEEELASIQADMEAKALDVENHARIDFVSEEISLEDRGGGEYRGRITGQVTLRGVTKNVSIPLSLTVSEERLRAQGEFEIKGTDFGIDPITAAGGAVKTSDSLELTFDLVGARE
ncbi:MAG TPA: YceI family protein [Vicinamibacteria bacterium]|jgi:polyisoprenoid-binding protein YceI